MSKMIIGCDPGASGALVALLDGEPIEWLHMPTVPRGKTKRVNGSAVRAWIMDRSAQPGWSSIRAHIEQVGAMAKGGARQGASSAFSFGHAAGVLEGVIQATSVPYTLVLPPAWKKRAGIPVGAEKDASRALAIQLWPNWRELHAKGKGQALADAALIARFGGAA